MASATASRLAAAREGSLIARPDVVVALALLVLNDRFLKSWWPGWATGKLSDVAGLYVFPVVLACVGEVGARVLGRMPPGRRSSLGVSAAATVTVFAAIKLNDTAGDGFRVVFGTLRWPLSALENWLGSDGFAASTRVTLVSDATDLVVLPAATVAWWVHGRTATSGARRGGTAGPGGMTAGE